MPLVLQWQEPEGRLTVTEPFSGFLGMHRSYWGLTVHQLLVWLRTHSCEQDRPSLSAPQCLRSWTGPHGGLDCKGGRGGRQTEGRICLKGAAATPVPLFPFASYLSGPFFSVSFAGS